MTTPNFRIRFRRDRARRWASTNPVLAEGEAGFEIDTGRFKLGDGVAPWSSLPYFSPSNAPVNDKVVEEVVERHVNDPTPHPAYDDIPSLRLLFENRMN